MIIYKITMTKVIRFEDLRYWQLARELVKIVYQISEQGKLAKDYETKDQLKRAALGVMNNIEEGFGRFSNKEFIRFLDFSQSSAIEVKSITYALEEMEYLPTSQIIELREKAEETKNSTLALIRYLRNKDKTNNKKIQNNNSS